MEAVHQINEIRNLRAVNNLRERRYFYKTRINPFITLSEMDFKRRYRISKETARFIVELIQNRLEPIIQRRICISPELQVLITLRFFAKGLFQEDNGDLHGISQKSVSKIIKRVSIALASQVKNFVKFPENVIQTKRDFYKISNFPNIVGCIDCTHIRIKNPDQERPLLYCNRKGFYSLNVQVVCDAKGLITDLVARWRGSVHDSRIWDECALKERFENGSINGILLGDSGYACCHYLLTPLLNPRTPAEHRYNSAHIRTRTSIERLFGQWKAIFRALHIGMNLSIENTKAVIAAIAVVHNIRKIKNQDDTDSNVENSDSEEDELPEQQADAGNTRGHAFRTTFIQKHFGQ